MTIQKAIEDAIKGGWDFKSKGYDLKVYKGQIVVYGKQINEHEIVNDPKFWQALGKELGWKTDMCFRCKKEYTGPNSIGSCNNCGNYDLPFADEYVEKIHQMIDHIINGGNINSYFKTLD